MLGAANFERFALNKDGTDLANLELYDEFPLPQVGGSPFFDNPLRDSFNRSWILGIAIPIDLGDIFTRKKTEE